VVYVGGHKVSQTRQAITAFPESTSAREMGLFCSLGDRNVPWELTAMSHCPKAGAGKNPHRVRLMSGRCGRWGETGSMSDE